MPGCKDVDYPCNTLGDFGDFGDLGFSSVRIDEDHRPSYNIVHIVHSLQFIVQRLQTVDCRPCRIVYLSICTIHNSSNSTIQQERFDIYHVSSYSPVVPPGHWRLPGLHQDLTGTFQSITPLLNGRMNEWSIELMNSLTRLPVIFYYHNNRNNYKNLVSQQTFTLPLSVYPSRFIFLHASSSFIIKHHQSSSIINEEIEFFVISSISFIYYVFLLFPIFIVLELFF